MIGIYGGTFNPVHYGHLRTAVEVKERLALQHIRMLPCRLPAHRQQPEASPEMRLSMLELAISATPGLQVDQRELQRPGPSYMVDTLQSLRTEFAETPLILIIGSDAFAGLESWHEWQRLFEYAHLVVVTRPGYMPQALPPVLQTRWIEDQALLAHQTAGHLLFLSVTLLDISATQIRQLIASGSSAQFLLPDAVLAYIQQHQLFQQTPPLPSGY
ncbi:nicotinate-nucleotide adenylyltransferase [Methylomonas sp. AM2-LC]|uniref:nicotinate-nucleotide adenylyltransferase n=1 Tax=Methylomonas sp. AM2-LC TaxID=3153301 RepID=UPI003264FD8E